MISKKWGLPLARIRAANHMLDLMRQGCPRFFAALIYTPEKIGDSSVAGSLLRETDLA